MKIYFYYAEYLVDTDDLTHYTYGSVSYDGEEVNANLLFSRIIKEIEVFCRYYDNDEEKYPHDIVIKSLSLL